MKLSQEGQESRAAADFMMDKTMDKPMDPPRPGRDFNLKSEVEKVFCRGAGVGASPGNADLETRLSVSASFSSGNKNGQPVRRLAFPGSGEITIIFGIQVQISEERWSGGHWLAFP